MRKGSKRIYNSAGLVVRVQDVLTRTELEKDVAECRKELGLRPLTPSTRICLRCDGVFQSDGSHNRVCGLCKIDYLTMQGTDDSVPIEFRKSMLRVKYEYRMRMKL
jgi:hypothetical protein